MASWVAAYTISGSTSPRGESWCNSRSHTSFLCLFRRASPEGRGYPGELPAATPAQRRGAVRSTGSSSRPVRCSRMSLRAPRPQQQRRRPAGAAVSALRGSGCGQRQREPIQAPAGSACDASVGAGGGGRAASARDTGVAQQHGHDAGDDARQPEQASRAGHRGRPWRSAGNGGIGVRSARPHTLTLQATFEGIEMQLHAVPAAGGELRHAFVCCRRKRGRPGSRRPPCSAPLRSARCGTATGPTPPWCGSTPACLVPVNLSCSRSPEFSCMQDFKWPTNTNATVSTGPGSCAANLPETKV